MNYLPHRILVTGGAGFIGANFIHYTLRANDKVKIYNLDSLTYAADNNNLQNLPNAKNYQFIHGDINDRALVLQLLREYNIDTIVHFAAESHVDRSITGPAAFIQTNVLGTFNLLESARQVWLLERAWDKHHCRFHHISTDEVFGSLEENDPAFSEVTPYAPNSPYSASKAGSDHLVRAYFHTYGLPVTATNCSNNYGPYQHPEKFIPTVINSCLQGKPIPIYGDGKNRRDWLFVEDHCEAIAKVISDGSLGETYNVGGANEWSNNDIVNKICDLLEEIQPDVLPYKRLISYVTDRPGHDRRYAINADKIKQELNWSAKTSFETGLRATIAYYLVRTTEYSYTA